MSGQLHEHRAGGREFQILGDTTEKLRAPNDVCERNGKQIDTGGPQGTNRSVKAQDEM